MGANYNTVWNHSNNSYEFESDAKITFGDTTNLEIYYSSTNGHSYIQDSGDGDLVILSNQVAIRNAAETADMARFYEGDRVELRYNNNKTFETSHITEKLLIESCKTFEGKIMQKPPIFSALKREGKRLYQHARQGTRIEIKAREVSIEKFEITNINIPNIEFKVICSKGTYIRSLANDFGEKLKCGAYLSKLRRIQIGNFKLDEAFTINNFQEKILKQKIT